MILAPSGALSKKPPLQTKLSGGSKSQGNICYSRNLNTLEIAENHYVVCVEGKSKGVFKQILEEYAHLPVTIYDDQIIIPGMTDLHIHAPQYSFRGLGMDLELLDWLETNTFPEEVKYENLEYADKAYSIFTNNLKKVQLHEHVYLQPFIVKQQCF